MKCFYRTASACVVFCGWILTAGPLPCAASEESVDRATQSALAMDVHPEHGAALYAEFCAKCHGPTAQGNAVKRIPALAGQRFAYLVRQLADFSGAQRDSATMHAVVSQPRLREPQTWADVAAHLNGLELTRRAQTGDGLHSALGRGIFHEQCASCHGSDARGDSGGFVPSLRSQDYGYLAGQMHKLAAGHRHNVDENLVRFLASFDDQEIAGVADYLSRLHGPYVNHKRMRNDGYVVD